MTYLAFKTTPRDLYLSAFMSLSFPPTLNRVDQYKQWDTVETRLILSNSAASPLFSGISCWESHCHITRILKQSYGEWRIHVARTETYCQKAAQICHLCEWAISETDLPAPSNLWMTTVLADVFTAISLVLGQNHPVRLLPDTWLTDTAWFTILIENCLSLGVIFYAAANN